MTPYIIGMVFIFSSTLNPAIQLQAMSLNSKPPGIQSQLIQHIQQLDPQQQVHVYTCPLDLYYLPNCCF